MANNRNQFTFYKSFDDVCQDLPDKELAIYIRTLLDVQFLRVRVEDVSFKNPLLNILWKAQIYSINNSISGYLDSQKSGKVIAPFLGVYSTPYEGGKEGACQAPCQQEQGQGKGQGKGKEQYASDFENFYSLYPNKKGKQKAAEAYLRARRTVDAETILAGLTVYKKECGLLSREQRFIKHPATWLNAGSWADECQTMMENSNATNVKTGFNKSGVFGRKSQSEEIAEGIERVRQDYRKGSF
jgi:hypothetical protein